MSTVKLRGMGTVELGGVDTVGHLNHQPIAHGTTPAAGVIVVTGLIVVVVVVIVEMIVSWTFFHCCGCGCWR